MKKYLMTGVAALAICAAFTSCSKSGDELYNPDAVSGMNKEKITETYNARFLAYVGGSIAPDQDWGFGTAVGTRGTGAGNVYKPDMTNYPNYNDAHVYDYPAPITQGEREFVEDYFHNNPGFTAGLDISDFYVQHVSATIAARNGLFHGYEQNRIANGYDSNYYTEEYIGQEAYLDKLEVGSAQNLQSTQHIFDFNRDGIGSWDNVYVKGGSALQFGVHSSWGTDESSPNKDGYYWYFKCASITVPGDKFPDNQERTAYYVGICFYGKAVETWDAQGNPEKWRELGNENVADQICEDWILKIIPGDPNPPTRNYTIRVLGEDLTFANTTSVSHEGTTESDEGADFDFNDVVFDVAHVTSGTAEEQGTWIRLMAAGGTLPLYIGSVAEANEVHNMFKVSQTTMVNTYEGRHSEKTPVEFRYSPDQVNAKNIPIIVIKDGIQFELSAQKGEPASKIAVSNMNFDWADERQSIKRKYPLFVDWAQGGQKISDWWD